MKEPAIPQVCLVGSDELQGVDLRDLLRESILGSRLKLLGGVEPGTAILSAGEDEATATAKATTSADSTNPATARTFF